MDSDDLVDKSFLELDESAEARPRTKAREEALRAVFMCDFSEDWSVENINLYFSNYEVEPEIEPYASMLCRGVASGLVELESLISRASDNWSISRMGRIDRCILRLAVFELLTVPGVPIKVVINEAVELAKRYGADNTPVFVNGIMDKLARMHDPDFFSKQVGLEDATQLGLESSSEAQSEKLVA